MRTEIMVPFTFDTTPIEQALQQIGVDELREKVDELIERHVNDSLPTLTQGYGWNSEEVPSWKLYLDDRMSRFINDNSDEIISQAALLMAQRGSRKKAWKEVLAEVREQDEC